MAPVHPHPPDLDALEYRASKWALIEASARTHKASGPGCIVQALHVAEIAEVARRDYEDALYQTGELPVGEHRHVQICVDADAALSTIEEVDRHLRNERKRQHAASLAYLREQQRRELHYLAEHGAFAGGTSDPRFLQTRTSPRARGAGRPAARSTRSSAASGDSGSDEGPGEPPPAAPRLAPDARASRGHLTYAVLSASAGGEVAS